MSKILTSQLQYISAIFNCPPLPQIPNAVLYGEGEHIEAVGVYICEEGFVFEDGGDLRSVKCLLTGHWTTLPTHCSGNSHITQCHV